MSDDIHDLVTGYVLDELSDGESAAFRAHMEDCQKCRSEVESIRQVAIELWLEGAQQPPSYLRASVLDAVARTHQEEPAPARVGPVIPIRSRPRWLPTGIAAAIVLLALLGWSMLGSGRVIDAVLTDPLSVTIEATAGVGQYDTARVVFSETRNAAVLVVEGLEQLPSDRTYELWIVDGDQVLPAGLFNTGSEGSATILIEGEIRPGMVVAVTEEPAGGVDVVTGEILFSAPVDA